jgi:hypothetical protein
MGKIEEGCCDIARLTLANDACMESSKKLLCRLEIGVTANDAPHHQTPGPTHLGI